MENKELYYKPSMEEFHTGFEFEVKTWLKEFKEGLPTNPIEGEDFVWKTMLYETPVDIFNREGNNVSTPDCIRVKYLDKEDIESLDWTNFHKNDMWRKDLPETFFAEIKNVMAGFDFENHIFWCTVKDPTKSLDGLKDEYDYPPKVGMFRGYIKNKSELKILMKQLNII